MNSFILNRITSGGETIAGELRRARTEKNISLESAAQKTAINIKYLRALEEADFKKLPAGIYGRKFLQEYILFLDLKEKNLLDIFDKEIEGNKKESQRNLFSRKTPGALMFLTLPKIVRNVLIVFTVLICIFYIGFYIKEILSPPALAVYNLQNDFVTPENYIIIEGKTEPAAAVYINDKAVLTDREGFFKEKVGLKNGLNIITVVARKKYSKESVVTGKVLVKEE